MRPQPHDDRIARFLDDSFTLDPGGHPSFDAGHCATEAAAWLAGEDHTDRPDCMSPIVSQFLRTLNDNCSHDRCQALKPFVLRAIGTDRDGRDRERLETCRAWVIRVALPEALELAGRADMATRLRDEAEPFTEEDTTRLLKEARDLAWTARHRAYRCAPEHPAVTIAGAAAATAAAAAAAGAGATAAAIYAQSGAQPAGFPADAGSYADASTVAASVTAGTYSDAAAAAVYTDPAACASAQTEAHRRLREAAHRRFEPLAEQLHGEAVALLDGMLG